MKAAQKSINEAIKKGVIIMEHERKGKINNFDGKVGTEVRAEECHLRSEEGQCNYNE